MIRRFSATWVYTLNSPPLKNGIVAVEDDGIITEVIDTGGKLRETERLEHHSGIIVPGFVNTHCHLELSHLKGKLTEHAGLGHFLGEINLLRNVPEELALKAVRDADRDMYRQGIVAVGDVSNTLLTIQAKKNSQVLYYTFVESFGFLPSRATRAIDIAAFVWNRFNEEGLTASIVPHSPYSVSRELFHKIRKLNVDMSSVLSMHNQESSAENQFFRSGDGAIREHLGKNLGLDTEHWVPTGLNSLESVLPLLPKKKRLLLVHNTYTASEDIRILQSFRGTDNVFMVICPNANLFIENRLPDIELFRSKSLKICLGTDSLASNRQLSILREMIALQSHFPDIGLNELLTWACLNGAKALNLDHTFGTIEPGKSPGLVLIKGADLINHRLNLNCTVRKLA